MGDFAKIGGSFFKNVTTGESGASVGVKALFGYEVGTTNPPGVPITTPAGPVTQTVSLWPFKRNLTTGKTTANFSFSLVLGFGGQITFNATKYAQLASKCEVIID